MTINADSATAAIEAWVAYQALAGSIKYPATEEEYNVLHTLADNLTNHYDPSHERLGSLYDTITAYLIQWQGTHPDVLDRELTPAETLEVLMKELGVSQAKLAREIGVNQSTVSRALKDQCKIGSKLANKLAAYFSVSRSDFL